jgi:hypothetical protein
MSALTHSLTTLWSRFRWEILGYLMLLGLSCIFNRAEAGWSNGVASLRTLALYWLTFRILLCEGGFNTHGGWRARPFAANSIFISQILLLTAILLPEGIAKVATLHHLFHPTQQQWISLLKSTWSDTAAPWLAFGVIMKGFDFLLLRGHQGSPRKAVWAMMAVVLVPAFFIPASKLRRMDGRPGRYSSDLSEGIRRLLPEGTDVLGGRSSGETKSQVPQARLLCRFPLTGNPSVIPSGIAVISLKSMGTPFRSNVTLDLAAINRTDLRNINQSVPLLAYGDGTYARAIDFETSTGGLGGVASNQPRMICRISFASPRALPENRQMSPAQFQPTELLFFIEDTDQPLLQVASILTPQQVSAARRILPHLPTSVPLDLAVRQLIDNFNYNSNIPPSEITFPDQLPREAMAPVLAYHPWSDLVWERIARPFLQQQATEADKPALLQRLATDLRLTRFFVDKGWSGDAVPVLRERARQRLSFDAASLMLLVRQNDPTLNADLAALAIRLDSGVGEVAEKLRQIPAFDWPAFVAAGWKSRKYGSYENEGCLFACWSAELGDSSGFRRLSEKAAAGRKWEAEKLHSLVTGEHEDLIGYLRKNIDRMKYDRATKKWGM